MTTRNACRLLVLVVGSLAVLGACTNNNGATGGTGGSGGKAGSGGGTAGSGGGTAGSSGTAGSGGAGGKAGTNGTGGTAGRGGSVGTGGTAGTGGTSNAQPDAAVFTCIQTSDDGLIADFATDNGLNPVDGRQGGFYVYGDGTGTFDPAPVVCESYPIDTNVGNPTCSGPGSFHVKATGFAKWGAALGVDFAPGLGAVSGSGGTSASGGSAGAGGTSGNGGSSGNGSGGSGPGGSGAGGKGDAGGTSASGGNGGSGSGGKSGGGGSSVNGGNSGVDGGSGGSGSGGNGLGGTGSAGNGSGGNSSGGTTANAGTGGSGGSGGSATICAQLTDAAPLLKGNYDASKYKGVSFWAKSTAPISKVQVSFPDIYTDGGADPTLVDPNATRCGFVSGSTINCSPYLVKFGDAAFPAYMDYQIDTTWKRFDIYFDDTQQDQYNLPGLSVVTPKIDSAHLTAMAIQANAIYVNGSPTPNDFEIWVDDINFIQ